MVSVVVDTWAPLNHLEPVTSTASKTLHCRIKNPLASRLSNTYTFVKCTPLKWMLTKELYTSPRMAFKRRFFLTLKWFLWLRHNSWRAQFDRALTHWPQWAGDKLVSILLCTFCHRFCENTTVSAGSGLRFPRKRSCDHRHLSAFCLYLWYI